MTSVPTRWPEHRTSSWLSASTSLTSTGCIPRNMTLTTRIPLNYRPTPTCPSTTRRLRGTGALPKIAVKIQRITVNKNSSVILNFFDFMFRLFNFFFKTVKCVTEPLVYVTCLKLFCLLCAVSKLDNTTIELRLQSYSQ